MADSNVEIFYFDRHQFSFEFLLVCLYTILEKPSTTLNQHDGTITIWNGQDGGSYEASLTRLTTGIKAGDCIIHVTHNNPALIRAVQAWKVNGAMTTPDPPGAIPTTHIRYPPADDTDG